MAEEVCGDQQEDANFFETLTINGEYNIEMLENRFIVKSG